jgi:hypothetical protein
MSAIIDRKRYDCATATLLCGDDYWDGHNFERSGTNRFLYRTPRGRYFFVQLSQWEGSCDSIEPCSEGDAIQFFESCRENDHRVPYEEAFPKVQVEEA